MCICCTAKLNILHCVMQLPQVRSALGLGADFNHLAIPMHFANRRDHDCCAASPDFGEITQFFVRDLTNLNRMPQVRSQLL